MGPAIDALEPIYNDILESGLIISRADLWAIAGRAAADYGLPENDNPRISVSDYVTVFSTFEFGRIDCDTTPYTGEIFNFPSPQMTHIEMMDWFRNHFENKLSDKHVIIVFGFMSILKLIFDLFIDCGIIGSSYPRQVYCSKFWL